MKGNVKAVAIVVAGVVLAGFLLKMGKDLPLIGDARDGYRS